MLFLFSLTLFVAAALLFLLELIFAKMILPLLGGSPSVWVTSLLFFQATLLAGYAYGHATTRWLGARRQAVVHLVVAFLPLLALPFAVPAGWIPPVLNNPVPWVLLVLLVAVGLPFFAAASTAPVLQGWFADSAHRRASDPYFLYRASNLGSLIGLLAYPLIIEPNLTLSTQSRVWAATYVVLLVLLFTCAIALWRSRRSRNAGPATPEAGGTELDERLTWTRRLRWLVLAFVPSSLLLGITSFLTSDIAPIPLLWVIPLSLYLLSFILVFSPRYGRLHRVMVAALPFAALPLIVVILLRIGYLLWLAVPLSLTSLFLGAMVCHGELAKDRPEPRRLTEFYLWIALGGLMGGIANALIAPLIFTSFAEVPLALAAAVLLRPDLRAGVRVDTRKDVRAATLLGGLLLLLSLAARASPPSGEALWAGLLYVVAALMCLSFVSRSRRFGGCVVTIMLVAALVPLGQQGSVIYADRNFFGAFRVVDDPADHLRYLFVGNTVHGAQSLDPARRLEPLTYFTRSGPLGDVFRAAGDPSSVGMVGLGTGSTACYAGPGDHWTFYEINPAIVRMALDPNLFTFLRDCPGQYRVVLGDARLSLERAPDHGFDVLVLDAFNSDAVPVHLLTLQALTLYGSKLAPGGLLAFNVTNRYLDLAPVLGDLAAAAGWVAYVRHDQTVSASELAAGKTPSSWVVMARDAAALSGIDHNPSWQRLVGRPGAKVWTDDYSNILSAFDWG